MIIEQTKQLIVGIVIAVLAYLKPIEGELWSLFLIFFVNFLFGYLSGMIAYGEEWNNKKALRCVGEATIFFVLCTAIYAIGRMKGQMSGAVQCVSFVTYVVIYFYALNVLKNCKLIFRQDTAPWHAVSMLYYVLRLKFVERIPFLSDYLNTEDVT
ncbi:MAG: hypothetical protein IKQ47_07625 [Prevotella sp.]|nr:hypothetical protein [Prevotella sp.]